MRLSVLMSVYAKESPLYLKQALDSILSQSRQPDEVVIVKDGPIGVKLEDVINGFMVSSGMKSRIKVVALKDNSGLGVALNAGLRACSHEVVARIDSDDVSLPTRFELQMEYITSHPGTVIVSSNIVEFDDSLTEKLSVKRVPETDREIKKYIRRRSPFNHMAVMYMRDAVMSAGSYEDVPFFEDYYLWLKMYAAGGEFYNFQESLVYARAGDAMIARRGGISYARNVIGFYGKVSGLQIFSKKELVRHVFIRATVAVVPLKLRSLLYRRFLRSSTADV